MTSLHPDTIAEVKSRSDIVDVVSQYVVLKKRGKDFLGLCPFHEERSPSFSVSPSKQMYYCFGCGAGGNGIKFLMELNKQSFQDVVLDLAKRYQVPVQTLAPEESQELQRQLSVREQLYEILAVAGSFYQHALRQPLGSQALAYLREERGLSDATIQQFQLGYAPPGWETLSRYLVPKYPVELVMQAGLIKPRASGGGYYDIFRNRIIIPIHDDRGRIIGFGGRLQPPNHLGLGEMQQADSSGMKEAKYLNSPETQLFDKGKTLFALDKAKAAITKEDRAVVVEGYFDAIALHAHGIQNAVATLGTAISIAQVRQLLRYSESKQIVLNFDADAAGTKAASRAIGEIADLAYKGEVNLRILGIPEGKDADEYLKNPGAVASYRQLLETAPLWLDWQIDQILLGKNLKQADQYQQVARGMVALLKDINDSATRTYYVNRCAEFLAMGEARTVPQRAKDLLQQINRPHQKKQAISPVSLPVSGERTRLAQAEALFLRLYLHCPECRQLGEDALAKADLDFSLSHHRFLWQQIMELGTVSATPDISNPLLDKLQERLLHFPAQMASLQYLFHVDERTERDILRAEELIVAAVAAIEQVMCEKRSRYFLKLWEEADRSGERDRAGQYLQEFYAAKQRIKQLDEQLNFLYFFR
ncbi:MAG: DNA primase [Oscillatoriaceae cyanobacterium]